MHLPKIRSLELQAVEIRRSIINMGHSGKKIHFGGSLSVVDILTVLYFDVLRHDPRNPSWPNRDRFIFSKGHASSALYAVLAHAGYFPLDVLQRFLEDDSPLQGHPSSVYTPGVETSSGSLGLGLSVAVGEALAAKLDGLSHKVYCLIGDGELNEGQVWEAAMSAGHFKLDNLVCIVDRNALQYSGATSEIMDTEPLLEKWAAFRWHVQEVDGHSVPQLLDAFAQAAETTSSPSVVIAHTVKGKGISFMENQAKWHSGALSLDE
ncbi:MAG: transketolase, partial [Firmicutes bacterium]|nr:transketolase [Bacillota bacterium]